MGVYQCIKAVFVKSWKIQWRYKIEMFSLIFRPLLNILPLVFFMDYIIGDSQQFIYNTGTGNYKLYIVFSLVLTNFIVNTISSSMESMTNELQQGTLESVLVLPVNMELFWCTQLFFSMFFQLCSAGILLLVSCVLLNMSFSIAHIGYFLFVIILCIGLNFGIGMFLSGVTLKTKMPKMAYLILSIITFLAGEMYPITIFPPVLKIIAYCNPVTYLLDLVRYSVLGTTTYLSVGIETIILLLLSLVIFFFCIWQYRLMIKNMKKKGNLTNY